MNMTTREIQEYLRTLSFQDARLIPVTVDGIYGAETEDAVKIFQRFYGLPSTGEVDTTTWSALTNEVAPVTTPIIQANLFPHRNALVYPDTQNETVAFIQVMLNSLSRIYQNISPVTVNGRYDKPTVQQIKELQQLQGTKANGIVDLQTWNTLVTLFNNRHLISDIAKTG